MERPDPRVYNPAKKVGLAVVASASRSRLRSERERHLTMTQRFFEFKVLATVLATLIVSGPARAVKAETPFKGTSSGVVTTVGFDPEQLVVYTHPEGRGEATELGQFT